MSEEQGDYDIDDGGPWHFWNNRSFFYGILALIVGFSLAFLPLFLDPADYSTPKTIPLLILFGIFLSIAGMLLLFYSFFSSFWNSNLYSKRRNESYVIYKESTIPALCGGGAYLLLSIVQSQFLPNPSYLSVQTVVLNVQNAISTFLVASFVGLYVCYNSIKYSSKIAPNSPFLRTFIYSIFAFFIVTFLSLVFAHQSDGLRYFLYSLAAVSPRFLVLGFVAGLVYSKSNLKAAGLDTIENENADNFDSDVGAQITRFTKEGNVETNLTKSVL